MLLEANNITKSMTYSDNVSQTILKNVSLTLENGEFVAIMGASGSGKSTLLYTLSGMLPSDSGSITLLDQDIQALSEAKRAALRLEAIGFVFQQANLLKDYTLRDNIILPASLRKQEPKHIVDTRADQLMTMMGVAELADKTLTQASGGQLQRIAICRALINHPAIIFADEPTGALNAASTLQVMEHLQAINQRGTTILLVTHDAKVAARANRILYMSDGQIISQKVLDKDHTDTKQREHDVVAWLETLDF